MEGLRQMNDWLEEKYGLTESNEDKARFIDYVGQERFDRFEKLKNSGRIKGNESDYYYWIKKPLDELDSFLSGLEAAPSNSAARKAAKKEGAELVYEDDQWKVYRIETYDAAIQYGKGTKWCISGLFPEKPGAGKEYFDHYKTCGVEAFYFFIPKDYGNQKWCYADYGEDGADNYTNILWDSKSNGYTIREFYMAPDGAPSDPLLILFGIDPDWFVYDMGEDDEDDADEMDESLGHKHSLKESNKDKERFVAFAGQNRATRFDALKQGGRIKGNEADYYYWVKKPVEELDSFLSGLESTPSKSAARREGATKVYEDGEWTVYKINTYYAAACYGKGTRWCITGCQNTDGQVMFDKYKKEGVRDYYFIIPKDTTKEKWCYLDWKDINDEALRDHYDNAVPVFFDSADKPYPESKVAAVLSQFPRGVVDCLPGLDRLNIKVRHNESLYRKHSLKESNADKNAFAEYAGSYNSNRFNKLKSEGRLTGAKSDYYYWINKHSVEELSDFLDRLQASGSKASAKKEMKRDGADLVYRGNGWSIFRITTPVAAVLYGEDTRWCISGHDEYTDGGNALASFEQYKDEGVENYYFLIPDNDPYGKWCFLDYGIDYNDDKAPAFWDSQDHGYDLQCDKSGRKDPIETSIPAEVLQHLPGFNEYKEKRQQIADGTFVPQYDESLDRKHSLTEAKEDREKFVAFAGQDLATRFDALKHGGRITGNEADYGYWEKKSVDELEDFIKDTESRKSKTQQRKETAEAAKASGADTVYEGQGWKILKIKNFDAAAYYGKGTKWCICGTKPNKDGVEEGRQEFDDYKAQGVKDFYFLIGPRDEKWCYTDFGSKTMMETQETFFDASNQVYYFGDLDYISSRVPPEVLRHLPWLSGGIDYALRMIDDVKGKVDQDGTYYYDGRDSMQTLVLLRGKVKKLIVGRDARSIQPQAFMGYSFLESVEFEPDSHLTSIGFGSFAACVKLKSIVIPKSVTSIGQYAFRFCFELASVKFESGSRLTNVGDGAFEDCKKLAKGVELPDGSICRVHITDLHERTD